MSRRKRHGGLFLITAIIAGGLAAGIHSSSGGSGDVVTTGSLAAFQSCVISRESGGDPQVWNKRGYPYWGLYQFGKVLWTAYGGSASSWGNADAAEQTQIFYNVMSHYGGCSNWTPSDGCAYPANGCD